MKLPEDIAEILDRQKRSVNTYHNIVRHKKRNSEVFTLDLATHMFELPNGQHFIATGED